MQISYEQTHRTLPYGTVLDRIETYVAGRYYYQDAHATPGEPVRCVREPSNEYDPNAVMLQNHAGQLIGYLPYGLAAELAHDLDAGTIILTGSLAHHTTETDYDNGRPPLLLTIHVADPSAPLSPVFAPDGYHGDFLAADFDDTDDDADYVAACMRDMELHAEYDEPEYFDHDSE